MEFVYLRFVSGRDKRESDGLRGGSDRGECLEEESETANYREL